MEHVSVNIHPEVAPPVLYVSVDERADGELGFSLAHMFDQTSVLLAYTSLDRRLDGMGESQRWGVIETKRLPEVQEQTSFDSIETARYIEPEGRERKLAVSMGGSYGSLSVFVVAQIPRQLSSGHRPDRTIVLKAHRDRRCSQRWRRNLQLHNLLTPPRRSSAASFHLVPSVPTRGTPLPPREEHSSLLAIPSPLRRRRGRHSGKPPVHRAHRHRITALGLCSWHDGRRILDRQTVPRGHVRVRRCVRRLPRMHAQPGERPHYRAVRQATNNADTRGINLHFPQRLSVDEHGYETDATILWEDSVVIEDISGSTIDLRADATYPGPWGVYAEHIGIPFTGLDDLIRHFNENPEDRPLLTTPQGVDLITSLLAQAHKQLTTTKGTRA